MTPTKTGTQIQVQGGSGTTAGLKAERIQDALVLPLVLPDPETAKLKAERIQLAIEELPGWKFEAGGREISRTLTLDDVHTAGDLFTLLAVLDAALGAVPNLVLRGKQVTYRVPTVRGGFIEPQHFLLAAKLNECAW